MKIIVVGNGMVGYKFCEKIRKKENAQQFEITVYGEEHRPAYDRVHLSEYFAGKTADDLLMAPKEWYTDHHINLITGELVTNIDPVKKTVITHKGTVDTYDKLILATGSSPFMPPLHGIDKVGVFAYRTIEDLQQMEEFGRTAKKAVVIGGGLLGLEAAKALLDMQLETHVVEFADRLMPRQLDARGATILKDKLTSLGLHIHTSKSTKEVLGDNKINGLSFADGSVLDCDMLVVSAGIRPRDELAKNSGISIGSRGGIEVNNKLQTNYPDIFAIGEVALHHEMIYGLVAPGYEMAEVVATLLSGDNQASFNGFDMSTKLKLIGVDVASFGDALDMDEECVPIVYENKAKGVYKRINITRDGKYLKGGILVGEADAYNMLLQITQNGLNLPEDPADLILGTRGANQSASGQGVDALPDTAQICSCEGITKGGICEAIEANELTDLAGVKKVTKACTGCGGCTPMVADLLKSVLESQGKQIKKTLCEHFAYTRQELYDLVRINDIKSYDELLGRYGQGDGCEICKPAVASLLASIWNEVILKQSTIQDTNDRFLANIQKGGSYSVVPRIPAGEITPDKLLVIAGG